MHEIMSPVKAMAKFPLISLGPGFSSIMIKADILCVTHPVILELAEEGVPEMC